MQELVFLKLGGSLLTDKTRLKALRAPVLERLAAEVAAALAEQPDLRLLIGHGSGSYGHVTASRYHTRAGVRSPEAWRGYADTALVAGQLNRLVLDALRGAGVPVLPVQPSASACCRDGELQSLDERPVRVALEHGLVPVVYGDVACNDGNRPSGRHRLVSVDDDVGEDLRELPLVDTCPPQVRGQVERN